MAKWLSNVSYVDFQKKKNVTEQGIYNSWYDKWLDIKRACDPSKTIVHEAITFIAALEFLFLKNPDEIIFNKELLTKKCKQGPRQRSRFLAQLADIYKITPHTSYDYKGKKYHFIYSAKRTESSLEILKNPQEFYKNQESKMSAISDKNDLHTSQKCLVSPTNLSAMYIANPASSQGLQEHRNIIETNIETDLSDLCSSEDSSLCIEGKDQKNQDTNFISSNRTKPEANKEVNNNTPVDELLEVARQEFIKAKGQQTDTHTRNGNFYHSNKLLNEFDFTDELIDAIREKSDKPHFSNGRITAVMRNIVAKNTNLRIWGGRQAFINYMVKAINNEKEFTKEEKVQEREEKARSLAEIKKKEAEQLLYDFEHRVIRYF